MKLSLFWQAWRVLPLTGKILFVAAEIISLFIYWSGTQAIIGQPGLGGVIVTSDAVFTTKIEGLGLLGTVSGIFMVSLITIAVTLDKHPEKILETKPKEKKSRFANPTVGISSIAVSTVVFALAFFDTYRLLSGYFTGDTTYIQFGIFAWFCIAIGLLMIGGGSLGLWLQTKKPKVQ